MKVWQERAASLFLSMAIGLFIVLMLFLSVWFVLEVA